MPEMWAQVPETEGASCDCSDPVQQALCRDPNLRGLPPVELAKAVGVAPIDAQRSILEMAGRLSGRPIFRGGISLDEALSLAGQPSARAPIVLAPEAGGFSDPVEVGGMTLHPVDLGIGAIFGIVLYSLLTGDEEEEEDDE